MKYAWIDGQRHDYPLQALCGLRGVNTSGYAEPHRALDGITPDAFYFAYLHARELAA